MTQNNVTEIVCILDRSGSMAGLEGDTVGGFNAMLEKQKKTEGTVLVSTVLFNDECIVVHDRTPIDGVAPMRVEDFEVGGCTALLDAIGGAIHHIGNIHKYARPEDVPAHTVFFITTDGMENASHRYGCEVVKSMIRRQQEKYGWEFIFMAANIDAVQTASRMGIRPERAVNYCADPTGTRVSFETMNAAVTAVRAGKRLDDGLWRVGADRDYKKGRR